MAATSSNFSEAATSEGPNNSSCENGSLIINADDWGRDVETTDRILECVTIGTVSSTSAMVFMEDSARAAGLAQDKDVDCGLHLNFTTAFSESGCPAQLRQEQEKLTKYLRRSRLAQAIYHPGLTSSFKYVVQAQIEQFHRLFGMVPDRIDGHHHMHLCANVLLGGLLPAGTTVRRNFSFRKKEKGRINRLYRAAIDRKLAKCHRLTNFFFSLPPLDPASRVKEIFSMARHAVVEVETHPVNPSEYRFLTDGDILQILGDIQISRGFQLQPSADSAGQEKLCQG